MLSVRQKVWAEFFFHVFASYSALAVIFIFLLIQHQPGAGGWICMGPCRP
jgi:hypothetical protein